jgi:ketosteroid isomerase-like protein
MEASSDIRQRNVELTRQGFEAYDRGDFETLRRLLHPDVEVHADDELINAGDFSGQEAFFRWSAQWSEAWGEFRNELRSIETIGDRYIVADVHQVARGAGSGVNVEMEVSWAMEADAGTVRRLHLYVARERALEAIERWRGERDA